MKDNKLKLKSISIGLLGDTLVGKTAIIEAFFNNEFNKELVSTIYIEKFQTKFFSRYGNEIKLNIWDTSGQERFRKVALRCLKVVKGLVLVFNVTDYNSFKNLDLWLQQISDNIDKKIPIILFGNKADSPKENWQVTNEQIKNFTKKNNLQYFEVSAKTKQGINEGFSYIVNEAYKMVEEKNKNIIIEKNISKKDDGCVGKNKKNKVK